MGVLLCETTGALYTLSAQTTIGRSRGCAVRLDDRRVSGEHARLTWSGDRWLLLDLGSRNGTWIRSARLDAQQGEGIGVDARFHFGAPGEDWRLLDAGAPEPKARDIERGEIRTARSGVIHLPNAEAPELVICQDAAGRWLLEQVGGANDIRELRDLEQLTVSGRVWQLHIP